MESKNDSSTSVLAEILLRNKFYQNKYYLALGAYLLSVIVILLLSIVLYYLIKKPTEPLYFAADRGGKLIVSVPVEVPNMSLEDVTAWTVEAVELANTYNFVNFHEQFQNAQKYFTDYGWAAYMNSLRTSNNLAALVQRQLVIVAKVIGKPKLMIQGRMGGAYAWKFEIPILVSYTYPPFDDKSRFQNPQVLTVTVQRQKILSSYKGLGIVQMIGNIVTAVPQTQNLNVSPPPQ